ncbi:MAX dimerization protein MGA a [Thalassophryne amazonica]|uniref:MAX dimerization protein MGA a n=1 Tax=Thalassophryne amazonica TaxID=390379 RepID=UPI0014721C11|nr:MAX dimerization protein MGA a [Thalassophryne amazonica]
MASKKKQKGMVFHEEGVHTPKAAPAVGHRLACFSSQNPGKACVGGMEQGSTVTSVDADMFSKSNMCLSNEVNKLSGLPAAKHSVPSFSLSPESFSNGIKVTLDNNSMWNEFFRCKTEMILTKQGSRMFPYCRFRISGFEPSKKYFLIMDVQPVDNSHYKWTGHGWQVAGKAKGHVKSPPFFHPASPSLGHNWMSNPISFYKLKLTNNMSDQEGNTMLHPMQRYLPRLHVIQTEETATDLKLNGPGVVTFTFPQTEFMAVTAYQNSRFAQLKVDYNPFAKGLMEDSSSSWAMKLKLSNKSVCTVEATTKEQHPVKKSLKSLLSNYKPRSSKTEDQKYLTPDGLLQNSLTKQEQPTVKATGESSCNNSHPPTKLISELIREAHVSLNRCSLEQQSLNNSASVQTEKANSNIPTSRGSEQAGVKKDRAFIKTYSKKTPTKMNENVTKKNVEEDKHVLKSLNCKDKIKTVETVGNDKSLTDVVAAQTVTLNCPAVCDQKHQDDAQPQVNAKQHKRPAPLPLPALARFLKQHSRKSIKFKTDTETTLPVHLPQSSSGTQSPPVASTYQISKISSDTSPSKDIQHEISNQNKNTTAHSGVDSHPHQKVLIASGHAGETTLASSSPLHLDADPESLRTDDCLASGMLSENPVPELLVPDCSSVLASSDEPCCTLATPLSTSMLTFSTSSTSPRLSQPLDTVLTAPNESQTSTLTKSSSVLSHSLNMKSSPFFPDSECSPFGFEPLSPAASPDPLPPFPASLALELDSTSSLSTSKSALSEELPHSEDAATSVFKWHTVLPPPDPYIGTSFATFRNASQSLPLTSVTSPLLSSETSSHPATHTIESNTSTPAPNSNPSFQGNEQSLPFPEELSPLALQLPLSPTFSSLDGDGLSPTPSLSDLVHFFSTNDDLGMEVEFPSTETVGVSCSLPNTAVTNASDFCQDAQLFPTKKPRKYKTSRRRRLAVTHLAPETDDSMYTSRQPNLEEVEEQLFVSFTSKEALRLHIGNNTEDPGPVAQAQTSCEVQQQQSEEATENVETTESLEDRIASFEKILLRDLKMMKHRQVIHQVLQEVGLKLSLLDPTLAIDLQYLGVRLPVPPPGVGVEPLPEPLTSSQSVYAPFVSRTGKTTDVTQIKGWRDKFAPSEISSTPPPSKPEAASTTDVPKNLSAFCSDMLDEYLEHEGKFIDERAASFGQSTVEPVVYELPIKSSSYVKTLDSILKTKQTLSVPTSELISGFVPPSKRPKLTFKKTKMATNVNRKLKAAGIKHKSRPESAADPVSAHVLTYNIESSLVPEHFTDQSPSSAQNIQALGARPPSEDKTPLCNSPLEPGLESRKDHLKMSIPASEFVSTNISPKKHDKNNRVFKRKKMKPAALSQTLSPSKDLAPLESDSELSHTVDQSPKSPKPPRNDGKPLMTRSLLKLKDLENSVSWEGRLRTAITEDRAAVALTSLFTLMGFVSENPTAPIQLIRRRPPPCLNDFCRLGCICSSLSHTTRITHCGRAQCMFGCSCLKQKVVLLKNLEGSDSSPSYHNSSKKRRKKRMKMAYVLKDADTVSQPAERVRILWKKKSADSDPDPIEVPQAFVPSCGTSKPRVPPRGSTCEDGSVKGSKHRTVTGKKKSDFDSCARVRGYKDKMFKRPKRKGVCKIQALDDRSKPNKVKGALCLKPDPVDQLLELPKSDEPESLPQLHPKPSKRLVIMAEGRWQSDTDRNHVLKVVCEAMAQERLDLPFWVKHYLITPLNQSVEESAEGHCIHYKIHISQPCVNPSKPAAQIKPHASEGQTEMQQLQEQGLQREMQQLQQSVEPETNQQGNQKVRRQGNQKERQQGSHKEKQQGNKKERQQGSHKERQQGSHKEKKQGSHKEKKQGNQKACQQGNQKERQQHKVHIKKTKIQQEDYKRKTNKLLNQHGHTPKKQPKRFHKTVKQLPDQQKERFNQQQRGNKRDHQRQECSLCEGQQQHQRCNQRNVQQLQEDLQQAQQQQQQVIKEKSPEYWQQEVMEEEDLLEDWQREVEEDQSVESWNWGEAVTDVKDEMVAPPVSQKNEWDERNTEVMTRKEKKQRMISMAVPFLAGVSSAGILSANKKQSGSSDHVVRVNGKDYPLARVQLGMMGALHPANRLAAYLMGRVGSTTKKQNSTMASSSSCLKSSHSKTHLIHEKPLQPTSSAASLSSDVAAACPTIPSSSVLPATVLSLPAQPMGVQPLVVNTDQSQSVPSTVPVDPVQLAGKAAAVQKEAGARVVTLKVIRTATAGTSQIRAVSGASSSSGPTSGTHNLIPVPVQLHNLSAVGQKMVLRAAPGVQLFRRPDGKLVQIISVNQLMPVQPVTPAKTRPAPVHSVTSLQHPAISVINQTTPLLTPPLVTSLSGFQSFTVSHINTPAQPRAGMLHQQGACTFKILPSGNTSDRLIITCPSVPTQATTTNVVPAPGSVTMTPVRKPSPVKSSASQEIEPGINRVAIKAIQDPSCTGTDTAKTIPQERLQHVVQTIPPTGTINDNFAKHGSSGPTTAASHLDSEANPVTGVLPQPHPSHERPAVAIPELACDLVDLDIICVDDETGLCTRTGGGACAGAAELSQGKMQMKDMEVVDLVDSSSSTEDLSSFEDDSDSDSEKDFPPKASTEMNNTERNAVKSALEKNRRQELLHLFSSLKKELALSKKSSKISVLTKATQEIERLKATEKRLVKQKRRLTQYRDSCLDVIAPKTGTGQNSFQQGSTKKKRQDEADVIEVVDLLEETDEQTDHSSDEDCAIVNNINVITSEDDDDVQMVTVETAEENKQLVRRMRNPDSIHISDVKTCLSEQTESCVQTPHHSGNEPEQGSSDQRHPEQERDRLKDAGAVTEPPTPSSGAEDLVGPETRTNADHVPSTPNQKLTAPPEAPPTSEFTYYPASTSSQHHHTNLQTTSTGTSHNAPGTRDRHKTVPNILSRSKQRMAAPLSSLPTNTEVSPIKALVPAEVLSLVGAVLPGQPVLTMSQVLPGQPVLQTAAGVATVMLDIPSLSNQQIQLTPQLQPPTGDSASNLASLALPPSPKRKAARPLVSTGLDQIVDRVKDQDQVLVQTEGLRPECSAVSPAAVPGAVTSLCPQQNSENGAVVVPQGVELEQAGDDTESFTSLLNEIDFLNQHSSTTVEAPTQASFLPRQEEAQTARTPPAGLQDLFIDSPPGAGSSAGGAEEQEHVHSPWLLELDEDSDSDEVNATEMEEVGLKSHTETRQHRPSPESLNRTWTDLAPPPLLQMKVGRSTMAESSSRDGSAEEMGRESSAAWRPMPRLVPLGLRGNPPS